MNDPAPLPERLDRTARSPLFDNSDEKEYWHSRSSAERLRHVQMLRQMNYGSRAHAKMQRVLEIIPLDQQSA